MTNPQTPWSVAEMQDRHHDDSHDYEPGSPHLRHPSLRNEVVRRIRRLIAEQFDRSGACRVLEVGAGHGGFTDHIAAAGAQVTVTEMSRASLRVLQERFAWNPNVACVHDSTGDRVFEDDASYDLILCISVLHHIPDYLSFVDRITDRLVAGGAFATFQDPLWYPRRSRTNLTADKAAFYAWRIAQGNISRGLRTFRRRMLGIYDETNPSDMVEYHVLRSGVDEERIDALLRARFAEVEQWRYWSTQSPSLQTVGTWLGMHSTFGIVARGRRPASSGE